MKTYLSIAAGAFLLENTFAKENSAILDEIIEKCQKSKLHSLEAFEDLRLTILQDAYETALFCKFIKFKLLENKYKGNIIYYCSEVSKRDF